MTLSKNRWRLIWLVGLALIVAACTGSLRRTPPPQQSIGTGLTVAPQFQDFYNQHGGAPIFGFPIRNPYIDPESGRLIQYFQQMILEYDQITQVVSISPLGEEFLPDEDKLTPAEVEENGPQRAFPETGFTVHDEFLAFFETNGDELIFGPPMTALSEEGGKLVQYFRNAKLVWNPNALPEYRVEIARLGKAYLLKYGSPVDQAFELSESATVLEADVKATVKEPILYAGEEQVLFVTVINPDSLQLVRAASVTINITYNGRTTELLLPETNDQGQTKGRLELPGLEPGQKVQVEISAASLIGTPLGATTLSFKSWW